jgi:hypothetical protein
LLCGLRAVVVAAGAATGACTGQRRVGEAGVGEGGGGRKGVEGAGVADVTA